jgi:hypothetical protein
MTGSIGLRARLARLAHVVRDEEGAGLTEFAFAFAVYVLVTMGTIQVAMWAFTAAAGQFAVWEGCRAGAAAYQPPPPDARGDQSLSTYHESHSDWAAEAEIAAVNRTVQVLDWVPITSDYQKLDASVKEEDVAPGEEGRREIVTHVRIKPLIFVPMLAPLLDAVSPEEFGFERSCRLRLGRFYSF